VNWLACWVTQKSTAWIVVVGVFVVAAVSLYQTTRLQHEDDLLAFLPHDNPDVALFDSINREFGTTDLALVGIEVANPFDPAFLRTLQKVTRDLDQMAELNHVQSLTNVIDFTPDPVFGGIVTAPLVDQIPEDLAAQEALRTKVMSRDAIVGNLISGKADAVLIYCYLAHNTDPRFVANQIRAAVNEGFPTLPKYWGGGPFVSTYIYDTTSHDLRRLTPWAVLVIVFIMMLVFRDLIGTGVVLFSTAIGTLVSLGIMATAGVKFNIVLSAMPVVLFAIGSAYGVHVLARYYALAKELDPSIALSRAVEETGPVVIAAGLTTAASLASFMLMDIEPLRTFGLFSAIGIIASLLLALTFVPAVIALTRLRRAPARSRLMREPLARLTVFAANHRVRVGLALILVALIGAGFVGRVDTRVDQSTFFSRGSPPDRAERFLSEHFGGSQFVQIFLTGDMGAPHVLREVRRLADQLSLLEHVSSVIHIGDILAQSNDAMNGQARIPDTAEQVGSLLAFLDDPSVGQMMTRDRSRGVLHVKLGVARADAVEKVLGEIEQVVAQSLVTEFVVAFSGTPEVENRLRDVVAWRVLALVSAFAEPLSTELELKLRREIPWSPEKLDNRVIEEHLARFLLSQENPVPLGDDDVQLAATVAQAVTRLGRAVAEPRLAAALEEVGLSKVDAADLGFALLGPLESMWAMQKARQRAEHLIAAVGIPVPEGGAGSRLVAALTQAMLDLECPTAMIPSVTPAGTLTAQVNGLPVMHRGLSESVTKNQIYSLVAALGLVWLIMSLMFRSFVTGLLAIAPTVLTLCVVYGGMGLVGVHLDIGTSMLACIVLGSGVDYAIHLVSAWRAPADGNRADAARAAASTTGPAIWTNAIMVTAGFAVLALGEAKPLQNVGSLTAVSMIAAALATFLAIPVLARRTSYRGLGEPLAEASKVAVEGEAARLDPTRRRSSEQP